MLKPGTCSETKSCAGAPAGSQAGAEDREQKVPSTQGGEAVSLGPRSEGWPALDACGNIREAKLELLGLAVVQSRGRTAFLLLVCPPLYFPNPTLSPGCRDSHFCL